MKNIAKYSELIQQYLANELSGDELVEFERLIKINSQLQDEIRLYRKVNSAIVDPSLENFKKELDFIHHKNFGSRFNLKATKYKPWYLAAAVVVVLITVSYLFMFQSANNPQNVFAKYYHPLEVDVLRSFDADTNSFAQAADIYNAKNYNLAFHQFNELVETHSDNYAARLYLGICAIELSELKIAEKQFKEIIESRDVFYSQDAEWYLALLYLKMGETEKAILCFDKIKETGCVYALRASLVLNELQ